MLELRIKQNTWEPPELQDDELFRLLQKRLPLTNEKHEWLLFLRIQPYIDAVYVDYNVKGYIGVGRLERFVFRADYAWDAEQEQMFRELCLNNPSCHFKYGLFDEIYDYYSEKYPGWNLKRYYTESIRMLDHIYHCMKKDTVKELLYKCGLDMLAKYSDGIDDLNLLASSPSEIYGGIPIRILRMLNCESGSKMLCNEQYRKLFKYLIKKQENIFDNPLNDAQCEYIKHLSDRELTPKEIARLYMARRSELSGLWNARMFRDFLYKMDSLEQVSELAAIDPMYRSFQNLMDEENDELNDLIYYLLYYRKDYDRYVRVSNRKRIYEWQERGEEYIVRYPQTINDFCREAVYMGNCLMGYVDAFINNTTTILFMRKADDVNAPFITMEIYQNELAQAYHRFNMDCTPEEKEWIIDYCKRHNIYAGGFSFNRALDIAE